MTTRRKFLKSVVLLSTGAAAGYLVSEQLGTHFFPTNEGGADRPPPSGLVAIEFGNGDVERIDNLIVSRSECEWMNRYHPLIKDPYDITRLLAGN